MQRRNNLNRWVIISACFLAMEYTAAGQKIIYVDGNAPGANDGTSWVDAYSFLQDALFDAEDSERPVEVWVAQGIYKPDEDMSHQSGTGNLEATFNLINGVTIKGGYAGFGQPAPDARDTNSYETILSGDLSDDDVEVTDPCSMLNDASRIDNSHTVVTSVWTDATAVLDGFTIKAGNANVVERTPTQLSSGGGMYNNSGKLTVINCIFIKNSAWWYGGGMNNEGGAATISNCTFSGNLSLQYGGGLSSRNNGQAVVSGCTFADNLANRGGGMANYKSSPTVANCTFSDNWVNDGGAGMYNSSWSNPTLSNCAFTGNLASIGGGIYNRFDSNPILTDCTFSSNTADWGGGLSNLGSHPRLTNCTFSGNQGSGGGVCNWDSNPAFSECTFRANAAVHDGGAMYNSQSGPTLTNCLFACNFANNAGGIYSLGGRTVVSNCTFAANLAAKGHALVCGAEEQIYPSEIELANCILWDGGDEIRNNDGSAIAINYCDIQGGQTYIHDPCDGVIWGDGNINVDPQFADPGYWEADSMPEDGGDNSGVEGDYHLRSQAGRWDARKQMWAEDDVTSPCIDAGDPMSLIGAEPFANGGRINMGAYGGTKEASKSYFGRGLCETIVAGDINGDCKVDSSDFMLLALHWLEQNTE